MGCLASAAGASKTRLEDADEDQVGFRVSGLGFSLAFPEMWA